MTEFKIVLDFRTKTNNKVMIWITLPMIIISLQKKNIVSQECTNTRDTIGMHKLIAWAQVTF